MVARHDQTTDPHITESLLLARRGTAYFSRYLAQLTAEDLTGPSLLPGWSRAHVVAHVGYHARQLAHVLEEIRTGQAPPVEGKSPYDINFGATLPQAALQNLHAHAAVHLNVEWRDLPAEKWNTVWDREHQTPLQVADTAWIRAREVWIHAVDLNSGARFDDFPPQLLDRLFHDLLNTRAARPDHAKDRSELVLRPTDRDTLHHLAVPGKAQSDAQDAALSSETLVLEGTLAALTQWGWGRGATNITTSGTSIPACPPWAHQNSKAQCEDFLS